MKFTALYQAGRHSVYDRYCFAILSGRTSFKVGIAILTGLLFSHSATIHASDNFWQSPNSESQSSSAAYSLQSADDLSASLVTSSEVGVDGRQTAQTSFSITKNLTDASSFTFDYADAREHRNIVLGYSQNNLSLSYMNGSGEDYASLTGEYSGLNPYLFHAGFRQEFDTRGFALDYGFGRFGHMQFGQATVVSDGLADRKARYLEWSNKRIFARATRFARGGEHIGNGLDLGFAFGNGDNKYLALQTMQLDDDRSMQRIRLQFDGKKSRQYWVDLSSHQNPLYQSNDDFRVMFSFKTLLGARRLASYQNADGNTAGGDSQGDSADPAAATKQGKGWKRALFIGAGVGAAAALSSSGSKSQDVMLRFRTQVESAFAVLNQINPQSIRENREYGGWVYLNTDGSYASTTPVKGEAASVQLPAPSLVIPLGGRTTATYHTHAAFDPKFDNENFSPTDLESDRSANVDGYLATPGGQFKYHNVSTGEVSTIGSVATAGG